MRRVAARHSARTMVEDSRDMSKLEETALTDTVAPVVSPALEASSAPVAPPVPVAPPAPVDPPAPPSGPCNGDNAAFVIDFERLLAEVTKHPHLFNKPTNPVGKAERQKEWSEVCQALFTEWDKFSARKKIERVREVERKWLKLRQSFIKGSVKKISVAKKKRQRKVSMSVPNPAKPANDGAMDMRGCVFPNNNNEAYDPGLVNLPHYEHPQNVLTDPIPIPSAAAQAADFARTYDVKKKPFYIPVPQYEEPVAEPHSDPNLHFALMLVPLLHQVAPEQRFAVWESILRLLKNHIYLAKQKINILQNELKYLRPTAQMVNELAQHYPMQAEPPHLDHTYPAPEVPMPMAEPMPPSSHGRPTNERGEIIYPETDQEDLDEV